MAAARTKFLTPAEKAVGQRKMLAFESFNGPTMAFLGETFASILAVMFGASDAQLGFVASLHYGASLLVPLFVIIFRGKSMVKVSGSLWWARGAVCLPYLLLLSVSGRAGVAIIIVCYSLFCIFRACGLVGYDVFVKSVTTLSNRGAFFSKINISFNFVLLLASLASGLLMRLPLFSELVWVLIFQMIGIVTNCLASAAYSGVPSREKIESPRLSEIFHYCTTLIGDRPAIKVIAIKWLIMSLLVAKGMTIPFLTKVAGFSSSLVIIYTTAIGIGYVVAGWITMAASDRVGSKPLIELSLILFLLTVVGWFFLPPSSPKWLIFALGIAMNFALQIMFLSSTRQVGNAIPEEGAAAFGAFVNAGVGAVALLTGFITGALVSLGDAIWAGGVSAGLGRAVTSMMGNSYGLCYLFMSIVGVVTFLIVLSTHEKNSTSAASVITLEGIEAIRYVNQLEDEHLAGLLRKRALLNLTENSADIAQREVHMKLHSPFAKETSDLIRNLKDAPRSCYIPDLIEIATNDDSPFQVEALSTLSSYSDSADVIKALSGVLENSKWASSRAKAAYSLSLCPSPRRFYPLVEKQLGPNMHINCAIDLVAAQFNMDPSGHVFSTLFDCVDQGRTPLFRQTIYCVYDMLYNHSGESELSDYFEIAHTASSFPRACRECLNSFRSIEAIEEHYSELIHLAAAKDLAGFLARLVEISETAAAEGGSVKEGEAADRLFYLRAGITHIIPSLGKADETDALALAYFVSLSF